LTYEIHNNNNNNNNNTKKSHVIIINTLFSEGNSLIDTL